MTIVRYVNRPAPFQAALGFLFADGEEGALYVPRPVVREQRVLFQDAAGTVPAGPGDPVGLMLDLSGNGNHARQEVAGKRPVLGRTAEGYWYLEFDGVDDSMQTQDAFYVKNPLTLIAATDMPLSTGSGTVPFLEIAQTPTSFMRLGMRPSESAWLRIATRMGSQGVPLTSVNSPGYEDRLRVSAGVMSPGQIVGRHNGSVVINEPQALVDEISDGPAELYLASAPSAVIFSTYFFFGGLAITEALEQSKLRVAERYFAALSGVTLDD